MRMIKLRELIGKAPLIEMKWDDLPPAYAHIGADEEAEIEDAARFPWNAMNYAQRTRKHHPKLWAAVKGSPFEKEYRRTFGSWIDVDTKRSDSHGT